MYTTANVNPINTEFNPIRHLLALLGAHHILHVSRIRVNNEKFYIILTVYLYANIFVLYVSQNNQRTCVPTQHTAIGFITGVASVYCAVRTVSLNKIDCVSSSKGYYAGSNDKLGSLVV